MPPVTWRLLGRVELFASSHCPGLDALPDRRSRRRQGLERAQNAALPDSDVRQLTEAASQEVEQEERRVGMIRHV